MALINKIKEITDTRDLSDDNIADLLSNVLNEYRRKKRGRKTYNLVFTDTIQNKHQLSLEIKIDGMSIGAVKNRINNDINFGFQEKKENKELTKQICKYLETTRYQLIVDYPIVTES